jgi:glycosyltransferase involved in cell wall biosynthesis
MRVSVVIDNYDYERFVAEAIESALGQTHDDVEVLVVDDGSTDASRDVIERFGVPAIYKDNGGQASAFNAGFAACTGEVVIFLDADDVLEPEAAARAARALADPAVAKVHWPLEEIDADGRRLGRRTPEGPLRDGDLREATLREGLSSPGTVATSGNAFARRVLERVMPMPETPFRRGADSYLVRLAQLAGRVVAIDQPLARYRVHGANGYAALTGIERNRRRLARYEAICRGASELSGRSVEEIVALDEHYRWMQRLDAVTRELPAVVPAGERMVLIDDDIWGPQWERPGVVAGRETLTFCGRPEDDAHAVAELERLCGDGAGYVVIGWPAFWWLDHYRGLAAHLGDRGRPVLENERVRVFELA